LSGRRGVFPQNRIPLSRQDSIATAFLEKVPVPNLPGETQNYLATPSLRNNSDQGVVRLDHRLNVHDSLFARVYIANFDTFQPFGSSLLNETLVPGFGYSLATQATSAGIGETHVFNAALVSEFRFGFLRVTGGQESQNQGIDFAKQVGIRGVAPR